MTMATIVAEVTGLGDGGDGRIDTPSGRLFIPMTAPGDLVRVRHDGERVTRVERLSDGSDRIKPVCLHFGICGGCAMQHIAPDAYAAWKRGRIARALAGAGLNAQVAAPFVVAPGSRAVGVSRATVPSGRAGE